MLKVALISILILFYTTFTFAMQNCQTNVVESTPLSQFIISGDTATDTKTGLIWKRCIEGYDYSNNDCVASGTIIFSWQDALQTANTSTFGGNTDWRVPNAKELASISELMCQTPALNETVFPNTPAIPGDTWSSSPFMGNSERAWSRTFDTGFDNIRDKTNLYNVRLVRGG